MHYKDLEYDALTYLFNNKFMLIIHETNIYKNVMIFIDWITR